MNPMPMHPRRRSLRGLVLCAACLAAPVWAWFGPSAESPYLLTEPHMAPTEPAEAKPVWTWVDARTRIAPDNHPSRDGYRLGDAVFSPRPGAYMQQAFFQEVWAHEERATLLEKLQGTTIRLLEVEVDVGLWVRLSERQSGSWETVRVRVVVEVNGERYEALQVHPFRAREKPSPAATPMRDAVQSLVQQILMF